MNETSENCRKGTLDDGTQLLGAMREAKLRTARFGFIVDAEVAAQVHTANTDVAIAVRPSGKYPSALA